MADYLIKDTTLTNIADAIREKSGDAGSLRPADMPTAIEAIEQLDTSDATAAANDIRVGETAYVNGVKVTGTIANQAAQTITPSTADQTIASGKYLSGTQTIKGDSNLVAENIKSGASIFGVAGSYEGNSSDSENMETCTVTITGDVLLDTYIHYETVTNDIREWTYTNYETANITLTNVPCNSIIICFYVADLIIEETLSNGIELVNNGPLTESTSSNRRILIYKLDTSLNAQETITITEETGSGPSPYP